MNRILAISHSAVVPNFRTKWELLAQQPDIDLTLLIPDAWPESGRRVAYTPGSHTSRLRIVSSRVAFRGVHALHFYPSLAAHLFRLRPAILHVEEEPWNLTTFQAALLGRRMGSRIVFFTWENLRRRYPFPLPLFRRAVLRVADRAIAGSEEARDILRERGFRKPIDVLPQYGVDPPAVAPIGRPRGSVFTVGFAGRLVPQKGLDSLLVAVATLPDRVRLLIVGDGPYRSQMVVRAAALGMGNQLELVGAVDHARMPAQFERMDALVLPSLTTPSWKEQFGRVLVEAMTYGVPVVGSTSGEIPKVIGDAGLVFPEGDVAALRGCLRRLLDEPAFAGALVRRGWERASSVFSNRSIADRTGAIYRALLRPVAPPGVPTRPGSPAAGADVGNS